MRRKQHAAIRMLPVRGRRVSPIMPGRSSCVRQLERHTIVARDSGSILLTPAVSPFDDVLARQHDPCLIRLPSRYVLYQHLVWSRSSRSQAAAHGRHTAARSAPISMRQQTILRHRIRFTAVASRPMPGGYGTSHMVPHLDDDSLESIMWEVQLPDLIMFDIYGKADEAGSVYKP